jgi:hypothetical protein
MARDATDPRVRAAYLERQKDWLQFASDVDGGSKFGPEPE